MDSPTCPYCKQKILHNLTHKKDCILFGKKLPIGFSFDAPNPKEAKAVADAKAPMEYLVLSVLEGDAIVHKHGADKYGKLNWRASDIKASTYVAAITRHLMAWAQKEDLDPDSMQNHLYHIRACCAVVLDAIKHNTFVDDREQVEVFLPSTE